MIKNYSVFCINSSLKRVSIFFHNLDLKFSDSLIDVDRKILFLHAKIYDLLSSIDTFLRRFRWQIDPTLP